jgi:hypothetical protein
MLWYLNVLLCVVFFVILNAITLLVLWVPEVYLLIPFLNDLSYEARLLLSIGSVLAYCFWAIVLARVTLNLLTGYRPLLVSRFLVAGDMLVLVRLERFLTAEGVKCRLWKAFSGVEEEDNFYSRLREIDEQDGVQGVFIAVSKEHNGDSYHKANSVYIYSLKTLDEIKRLLEPLKPAFVGSEGYGPRNLANAPRLNEGMKIYCAWWD